MPAPRSTPARLLGERIKARRHALGISQEALAERSGTHWTFVGQVERGQRNLNLHNLLKLAHGLQVDASELVSGLTMSREHAAEGVGVFARNLRAQRERSGLSQSQLSKRSGVHVTEISRMESGQRDPRMTTLIRLARALETPPSRLLDGV